VGAGISFTFFVSLDMCLLIPAFTIPFSKRLAIKSVYRIIRFFDIAKQKCYVIGLARSVPVNKMT
jgi:hypothetical protein